MDRHLKERMVGAVVLIAAANILIPEMLTGSKTSPKNSSDTISATSSVATDDASKLKTYTIDLSKAPSASAGEPSVSIAEQPLVRPTPEPLATTATPPPEESAPTSSPPPSVPTPEVAATRAKPEVRNESKPSDNKANAGGWSVQVGSFGVRATSERIAADLKKEGFSAFVVAFQSGNQTMYRVRVGPERDRAAAEGLLRKLKLHHPGATLVPPA